MNGVLSALSGFNKKTMTDLRDLFIDSIEVRIKESLDRIETCFGLLSEEMIWEKMNSQMNCAGNLVLHLNGNIRQYIISGLGMAKDVRQRNMEFELSSRIGKEDLWSAHHNTVTEALRIIVSMKNSGLTKKLRIQGFETNATDVLIHVTEHYSYHTGQIALLTKILSEKDLGFYKGLDLNNLNN